MRIQQRMWRWLRAEQGSQGLEAAGAALAAALIVLALLAGARGVLGPSVERAFQCAAAALLGGGGDCGGAGGQAAQVQPANSSTPAQAPPREDCNALCQVGGVFKGGGEVLWETVKGIGTLGVDGFKAATGDQATRDKYAAAWNAITSDPAGAARAIWDGIADPIAEDWRNGRYGEAVGRGLTEILGTVAGPKGVDKLGKLNRVDDLARGADRLDTVADTRRTVNRLPCVSAAPAGKGPGLAKPLASCEGIGANPDVSRLSRRPINSDYAGKTYPLDDTLKAKYGDGVRFDAQGFPDFTPYARVNPTTGKPDVYQIQMKGNRTTDFSAANRAAGYTKTPDGYTWHHHQDRKTMVLVPRDLHEAVKHTGGVSIIGDLGRLP